MGAVVHPTYFPNIATFALLVQQNVIWEAHDNFQKQTYRNRCHLCSDQGRQLLNIPIKHVGGNSGRQKYHEVKIDNSAPWQRQHLKTLQTAYRSSPFFEFYEDDLVPFFEKSFTFLWDANMESIQMAAHLLDIAIPLERTVTYQTNYKDVHDARFLVNAKQPLSFEQQPYGQVFEDRNGFIANTSVLDLLFNEGPNTLGYLKNQSLSFMYD